MGLYIQRCCPHCKFVLEPFQRHHFAIGVPIIDCSKCARPVIFDHINEWWLMGFWGKAKYLVRHIYTNILLGAIPGIFIYMGVSSFLLNSPRDMESMGEWIAGFMVGGAIVAIFRTPFLIVEIKKSNKRMHDIRYVEKLKRNNLLNTRKNIG